MNDIKAGQLAFKEKFDDAFKGLVDELVEPYASNPALTEAAKVLREALLYNTFDGKKSRGLMVIGTMDFLKDSKMSDDLTKKGLYLGWCVEILQALFLVADDIMDRSEVRRGKPCWYKVCGLRAINDTYLLEHSVYYLLEKYFSTEPYYLNIINSFHHITFLTAMGQELDMLASDSENFSLENFTDEKYAAIVKYKTAFYSFYLPVSLGMYLAGVTDKSMFKSAEVVLLKLGEFFQIQDDYLDCYGDPAVIGKVGRDIEDAKCSWLVVQALKKVTPAEKEILLKNYGKEDNDCVKVVKELYAKLKLQDEYKKFEEESFADILKCIESNENDFPKKLFIFLAHRIYKRSK